MRPSTVVFSCDNNELNCRQENSSSITQFRDQHSQIVEECNGRCCSRRDGKFDRALRSTIMASVRRPLDGRLINRITALHFKQRPWQFRASAKSLPDLHAMNILSYCFINLLLRCFELVASCRQKNVITNNPLSLLRCGQLRR